MRRRVAAPAIAMTMVCAYLSIASASPAPARPIPRQPSAVTIETLRSAEVPANCRLPAQRLVGGATTKGGPGGGYLLFTRFNGSRNYEFGDFAQRGYQQALAVYGCTAGGVSWPDVLVLIGSRGSLLGSFDLANLNGGHEHADVNEFVVMGNSVVVYWMEYEGAGFETKSHVSLAAYYHGRLTVSEWSPPPVQIASTTEATNVVVQLLERASRSDKSVLNVFGTLNALQLFPPQFLPKLNPVDCTGTATNGYRCFVGFVQDSPTSLTILFTPISSASNRFAISVVDESTD